MIYSIALLIVIIFLAYKAAPRERRTHSSTAPGRSGYWLQLPCSGGLLHLVLYATGEMLHALRPYGLEHYGYLTAAIIALANMVFGGLYMYSLGIFNEGGGSYTASMRYLRPALSLTVAVVLIQDYVLTIVVSALSGGDQLLSILNLYGKYWWLHFAIGALLALVTWYITIRGRGESAQIVFYWVFLSC
jgi:hypothetical protein